MSLSISAESEIAARLEATKHYNAGGHVILGNCYSYGASFIIGYEVEFCLGFFILTDLKQFVSTFFFYLLILVIVIPFATSFSNS